MIKYLILDVDGTLTDGKIYMGADGELFKAFNVKDGCGIKDILPGLGIAPVIITARNSSILKRRCDELGIEHLHQGRRDKWNCWMEILAEINQKNGAFDESDCAAYMGDDITDLDCMRHIKNAGGIIGCPADAADEVLEIADFVSTRCGGDGAVREFIGWISKR